MIPTILKPSIVINGKKFKEINQIGEGGFAFVYDVMSVNKGDKGEHYALKRMICQTEEQLSEAKKEIDTMVKIKHANILRLVDFSYNVNKKGQKEVLLVMPLYSCSLQTVVDEGPGYPYCGFSDGLDVLKIMRQIADGINAIHTAGFRHADIKPANILLSEDNYAVITDFGSVSCTPQVVNTRSDAMKIQEEAEMFSTASYRAPELYNTPSECVLGGESDIWALGCLIYCFFYSRSPFESAVEGLSTLAVMAGQYTIPESNLWCQEYLDLLAQCLNPIPSERPDIATVITQLKCMVCPPLNLRSAPPPAATSSAAVATATTTTGTAGAFVADASAAAPVALSVTKGHAVTVSPTSPSPSLEANEATTTTTTTTTNTNTVSPAAAEDAASFADFADMTSEQTPLPSSSDLDKNGSAAHGGADREVLAKMSSVKGELFASDAGLSAFDIDADCSAEVEKTQTCNDNTRSSNGSNDAGRSSRQEANGSPCTTTTVVSSINSPADVPPEGSRSPQDVAATITPPSTTTNTNININTTTAAAKGKGGGMPAAGTTQAASSFEDFELMEAPTTPLSDVKNNTTVTNCVADIDSDEEFGDFAVADGNQNNNNSSNSSNNSNIVNGSSTSGPAGDCDPIDLYRIILHQSCATDPNSKRLKVIKEGPAYMMRLGGFPKKLSKKLVWLVLTPIGLVLRKEQDPNARVHELLSLHRPTFTTPSDTLAVGLNGLQLLGFSPMNFQDKDASRQSSNGGSSSSTGNGSDKAATHRSIEDEWITISSSSGDLKEGSQNFKRQPSFEAAAAVAATLTASTADQNTTTKLYKSKFVETKFEISFDSKDIMNDWIDAIMNQREACL
mmetsp:Transcript_30914/g.51707  ORF Transcript_30914/g.51707 Transcript_30914/m.51707 type:complete len:848 (+) Transcript_30914:163-2706(+)